MRAKSLDVRLVAAVLEWASRWPLRRLHALADVIARFQGWLGGRGARVAARNLDRCYPQMPAEQRRLLWRATLAQTARGVFELPRIWGGPPQAALAMIREVRGAEHLRDALATGKGVLIAAPHLGAWELLNLWLSTNGPLTVLYRPPTRPRFEALLRDARGGLGAEQVRAEPAGVRTLLRRLREGRMVGILPDQRPRGGEGVDAPMFGLPRRTMTLFGRLAERSGAAVVFAFAERLPRGDGFRIHVLPSPPGIADADAQVAAAALNQGIAACVERAVDQYQWTYKIYGYWEPGAPPNRFYDDPIAADPSEAGSA